MRNTLEEAADRLTDTLVNVEEMIFGLKLNVMAKVALNKGLFFGYGKLDGDWGLFIENPSDKVTPRRPICSSPLQTRLEAAKKVPHLLKALLEEREAVTLGVSDTIIQLDAFVSALNQAREQGQLDQFIDSISSEQA
jgi:hypothetical protein